jgi:ribosomal protein L17
MSVNEIELSVRAANCLNNANITTVGQLAMKTESEMLKYRNFGKKSLNEIKDKLTALGLSLGMNIDPSLLEAPKEDPNKPSSPCVTLSEPPSWDASREHRNMMLANLVNSLIKHRRITTTLAKAKAAQQVAERMVTLGKRGNRRRGRRRRRPTTRRRPRSLAENVHCRRLVAARLHQHPRSLFKSKEERLKWKESEDVVHILFEKIAPTFKDRSGGYTRIVKLATPRRGDAGEQAILEWVDSGTGVLPAPWHRG